jgi:hypothetical protein
MYRDGFASIDGELAMSALVRARCRSSLATIKENNHEI